jgi:hypothetical protein
MIFFTHCGLIAVLFTLTIAKRIRGRSSAALYCALNLAFLSMLFLGVGALDPWRRMPKEAKSSVEREGEHSEF